MKRSIMVLAALVLGTSMMSCDRPSGGGNDSSGDSGPRQQQPQPKRYGWGLPIGDVSPNFNEQRVYLALRDGDCAGAQSTLDQDHAWQGFASPRNVLLAQAAIEFCEGDTSGGTELFNRANGYGWAGLLPGDGKNHAACEYYRSAASLVRQRPRSEFACPTGEPPQWEQ